MWTPRRCTARTAAFLSLPGSLRGLVRQREERQVVWAARTLGDSLREVAKCLGDSLREVFKCLGDILKEVAREARRRDMMLPTRLLLPNQPYSRKTPAFSRAKPKLT